MTRVTKILSRTSPRTRVPMSFDMNDQGTKTILITNDSPDQLEMNAVIFKQAGYAVLTASGGFQGLQTVRQKPVDLIISDVIMPEGSGIELCRLIRADEKLKTVPILLVSALRRDVKSVVEGLEAGADDYVELPVDPLSLVARATRLLERKQIERVLQESEEKYRIVAETATDGIITIDRTSEILFVNSSAARIFGYPAEELLGQNLTILMPDYLRCLHQASLENYAKNGERHISWRATELQGLKKNGELVDIEVSFGESKIGNTHRFTGIIRDITERKLAEQKLIESEKQYRFMAETIPQQVWMMTPDGLLDYVNQHCHNYFGNLPENLENVDWQNMIHPGDISKVAENWQHSIQTGEPYEVEVRLKGADGSYHWHLGRASAMRNEKGEIVRWLGTNTEIDQLKKAEEALSEINEQSLREYDYLLQRLNTLAQTTGAAHDLTAIFNAILNFALASVPCSALVTSLYDSKKSLRQPIYMWYNGEETDLSDVNPIPVGDGFAGQAIKSGEVVVANDYLSYIKTKVTTVCIGFDQDEREPRSAMIAPMKIKGEAIGIIEVQSYEPGAYRAEHVTAMRMAAILAANAIENVRLLEQERVSAEQLRQSQKLESVGRLAGGIAHDFNNMLTAINGYSEMTLKRLGSEDPLRRNLEEIKKAGARSASLTQQLLAFSRQQVLQRKVLELNEIIIDTIKMLQRLIGEDVQLKTVLHSKLGQIEGDPGQLSQVIMNLAVNARDAMPKGGDLTIETANVYLDEEFARSHWPTQPGHYVLLSVKDNGVGIDPETQKHIFEPFYTTKEIGKGTGLGLATVYGIVKQSGGYIWLESKVGAGTTFNIYLPRINEPGVKALEEESEPGQIPKGTETILVVEDEAPVRSLIRQILEECGYQILEASNGVEALLVCEKFEHKIDLLLTDVVMPKMGGRDLAETLTETFPLLRVLLMSGYTNDAAILHDVVEMDVKFIQKPFTFEALATKVRECLDAAV